MTDLTTKDIKKISDLSRLELTNDELERYRTQLEKVIGYIKELHEVNTEKVEAMAQTTGLSNVWSEDIIDSNSILKNSDVLSQTTETKNDYFRVKILINKNEK